VGSDICQIAPNAAGVDVINCTPQSEFQDEEKPVRALLENEKEGGARNLIVGYSPSSSLANATNSIRGSVGSSNLGFGEDHRRLYDDSGANIDVLVVWTKDAECLNSGLPVGCTLTPTTESNMRGLINLAIAETNTAFDLSGIKTQLRLVHAYRDPDYLEPTSDAFNTALTNLRVKTDGKLDSVHAKRALYGADAVAMIIGKC
jgi:hypothetical protein